MSAISKKKSGEPSGELLTGSRILAPFGRKKVATYFSSLPGASFGLLGSLLGPSFGVFCVPGFCRYYLHLRSLCPQGQVAISSAFFGSLGVSFATGAKTAKIDRK